MLLPISKQLFLPGMPTQAHQKHRLFLALFPDAPASRHIAQVAHQLRAKHGLRGKVLPTDHFHVSLHHLGDFHRLPEHIIQAAGMAATKAAATVQPFEARFDRANSFVNKPTNRPCVLLDGGVNMALREFQFQLVKAFGAGRSHQAFTPHLTLFYDDHIVVEELVNPVSWKVTEFVLVHSVVGEGRYERLGHWPLQAGHLIQPVSA